MKPVFQTRHGWPHGNCLMASVASILERGLDECPELSIPTEEGPDDYWSVLRAFATTQGYDLAWLDSSVPKGYSVISVMQPSGLAHALVALDGEIIHNPLEGAPLTFACEVRGYIAFIPITR